jgi:spore germination cell wall hydrolase CwlJ-like protein
MVVSTPARCLAANIYHEARGEPVAGQYAVALVTVNRAKRQKQAVCKEVFKPKQFSWTNKHVRKVKTGWKLNPQLLPHDEKAWKMANKIAAKTLAGQVRDFTQGSTFYHTQDVSPAWSSAMQPTKVVGHHQFYSKPQKS